MARRHQNLCFLERMTLIPVADLQKTGLLVKRSTSAFLDTSARERRVTDQMNKVWDSFGLFVLAPLEVGTFKAAKQINRSCKLSCLASCLPEYVDTLCICSRVRRLAKFFPKLFVQEKRAPKTWLTLLFQLNSTEAQCFCCH